MLNHTIHPNTSLGEVHLKVSQLERSIAFYREVVGFEVLWREGNRAAFTADGNKALLVLEEILDAVVLPRRTSTGLYHFAILVPSRKDLSLSLRNLLKYDIRVGQSDHLYSEALYITDPDNNGIGIYRDRPREEWVRNEQGKVIGATNDLDWQGVLDEAGDQEWAGLQPGTTIGHIHLHVAELMQTEAFYCGLLGFEIPGRRGDSALFVSAGGYHHHIGLNIWAGVGAPPAPANAAGLQYYTIVLPNATALEQTLAVLRDADVTVIEKDSGWFVKDPSQNGILLVAAEN